MKEQIRVRVQYASRQQCCKTHKRPLPLPFFLSADIINCQVKLKTDILRIFITYLLINDHLLYFTFTLNLLRNFSFKQLISVYVSFIFKLSQTSQTLTFTGFMSHKIRRLIDSTSSAESYLIILYVSY